MMMQSNRQNAAVAKKDYGQFLSRQIETKNYVGKLKSEQKQQIGEIMNYKRKMIENQNKQMAQQKLQD